jgi:hypothetical protein
MAQVTLNLTPNSLRLGAAVEFLVARGVDRADAEQGVIFLIRQHQRGDLRFPGGTVRYHDSSGIAWLETTALDIAASTVVAPRQGGWHNLDSGPVLVEISIAALERLLAQARPTVPEPPRRGKKVALRPEHEAQYLEHIDEMKKAKGRLPTPEEDAAWAKKRDLSRAQWRDNLRRRLLIPLRLPRG